jgi:hypothetical protein
MTYSVNTESGYVFVYVGFQGKIKIKKTCQQIKNWKLCFLGLIRCFIGETLVSVRGASKIKVKSMYKKRMWSFSRRPLLIWLHCCFHHYKTQKAVAMATAAIVLLTPANFYHFRRPKFDFQLLSFTFETFGKKLAETKIVARVNVKKIKAKK